MWLFENSVAFNRFLVRQFNERLGQFIALVEYDRIARCDRAAWRAASPGCSTRCSIPTAERHLDISQEEIGLLSGLSRPVTNRSLQDAGSQGAADASSATA